MLTIEQKREEIYNEVKSGKAKASHVDGDRCREIRKILSDETVSNEQIERMYNNLLEDRKRRDELNSKTQEILDYYRKDGVIKSQVWGRDYRNVDKLSQGEELRDKMIHKLYQLMVEFRGGKNPDKITGVTNPKRKSVTNKCNKPKTVRAGKSVTNSKPKNPTQPELEKEVSALKKEIARLKDKIAELEKTAPKAESGLLGFTIKKEKTTSKGKVYEKHYAKKRINGKLHRIYLGGEPSKEQAEEKIKSYCKRRKLKI